MLSGCFADVKHQARFTCTTIDGTLHPRKASLRKVCPMKSDLLELGLVAGLSAIAIYLGRARFQPNAIRGGWWQSDDGLRKCVDISEPGDWPTEVCLRVYGRPGHFAIYKSINCGPFLPMTRARIFCTRSQATAFADRWFKHAKREKSATPLMQCKIKWERISNKIFVTTIKSIKGDMTFRVDGRDGTYRVDKFDVFIYVAIDDGVGFSSALKAKAYAQKYIQENVT